MVVVWLSSVIHPSAGDTIMWLIVPLAALLIVMVGTSTCRDVYAVHNESLVPNPVYIALSFLLIVMALWIIAIV